MRNTEYCTIRYGPWLNRDGKDSQSDKITFVYTIFVCLFVALFKAKLLCSCNFYTNQNYFEKKYVIEIGGRKLHQYNSGENVLRVARI